METIVALSSGQGRAAIALIRVSGPHVRFVCETFWLRVPEPRTATLLSIRRRDSGSLIDRGIALYFPGPASATGEDVLELQVHGSTAVVEAVIREITTLHPGIRLATPGEFTRRSLENGKLDLLQVEALGDLLEAETDAQLNQAQRLLSGALSQMVAGWQNQLTDIRARLEAELDFADEADVGSEQLAIVIPKIRALAAAVAAVLAGAEQGRRIRDGATVVIAGPPNAGKSALMNALAARSMSIVSDRPGTTRDMIECHTVIDGWPVVLVDTAGIRDSADPVEQEGIWRARTRAAEADIVLSLSAADDEEETSDLSLVAAQLIRIRSKADLVAQPPDDRLAVSAITGTGLDELRGAIAAKLSMGSGREPALIARERQRAVLEGALRSLERALAGHEVELVAEDLRLASRAFGRLVGAVDLDQVLDRLFAGFCIGK